MKIKWAVAAVFVGIILAKAAGSGANDAPLDDPEQEAYIVQLHEFARPYFRALIREIERQTGWKVVITSGHRTFAKQAQLYAENSQNAQPGSSYHNYGMAFDVNLVKNGIRIRKASPKSEWEATGAPAIARAMNFVWGGDFPNYHDPVHFDLRKILYQKYGYNTNSLKQKAFAQFGTNWANIQGNKIVL